jgi:hypothetical protein
MYTVRVGRSIYGGICCFEDVAGILEGSNKIGGVIMEKVTIERKAAMWDELSAEQKEAEIEKLTNEKYGLQVFFDGAYQYYDAFRNRVVGGYGGFPLLKISLPHE